jgi:hypothetical protein
MYVHRRTLVVVADRFLGVGCSLKSSLVFVQDFPAIVNIYQYRYPTVIGADVHQPG